MGCDRGELQGYGSLTGSPASRRALHCDRRGLFYLEEVEQIRVAGEAVWVGRQFHGELGEPGQIVELTLESAALGLRGRMDATKLIGANDRRMVIRLCPGCAARVTVQGADLAPLDLEPPPFRIV